MSPREISKQHLALIALTLKKAREEKAESISDAAFKIALSPAQLRAIEAGDLKPFYSVSYFYQAALRYADFLCVSLPEEKFPSPEPTPSVQITSPERVTESKEVVEKALPKEDKPITVANVQDNLDTAQTAPKPKKKPAAADHPVSAKKHASKPIWITTAFAASAVLIAVMFYSNQNLTKTPEQTQLSESKDAASPSTVASPSQQANPATQTAPAPAASPNKSVAQASQPQAQPQTQAQSSLTPQSPVKSVSMSAGESHLQISAATWVQIVLTNGEKQNLRTEPGQKISFEPEKTAAIVFGRPEQARLNVNGRIVDIAPFILAESPTRALVIVSKVR